MVGLSVTQERTLAITPKCTAALGVPFAIFLIYEVYCDHKAFRGTNAIKRVLMGMSIIDVLSSSAWFLSSWAVPRGTFALSAGNRASCNYQGFLLQLAIGAPLYNSSLALFYVLIIKYGWTDEKLASIERWIHAAILSFSVGTAILLLPLEQYNQVGTVCWIIGDPEDCGESTFHPESTPCKRGNHAWLYGLTLFYGPLWLCVMLCLFCMAIVYFEVRRTMQIIYHLPSHRPTENHLARRESELVAFQAILYSLSFLITWAPSTIWSIAHWFQFSSFWIDFAAAVCEPLQGFWNMMIFSRNRPSTRRKLRQFVSSVTFGLISSEQDSLSSLLFGPPSRSKESIIGHRSSIKRSSMFPSGLSITTETNVAEEEQRPRSTHESMEVVEEDGDEKNSPDDEAEVNKKEQVSFKKQTTRTPKLSEFDTSLDMSECETSEKQILRRDLLVSVGLEESGKDSLT